MYWKSGPFDAEAHDVEMCHLQRMSIPAEMDKNGSLCGRGDFASGQQGD